MSKKTNNKRKAQASVEFTILIAFGVLFLSVVSAAFLTQITLLNERQSSDELLAFATRVERNVNIAIGVDGYFYHPFDTGVRKFSFIFNQNPANHSLINSSAGDSLIFFDDFVTLDFRGNSSLYCVTKSSQDVRLTNNFISLENNKLFFGCITALTNITLEFSRDVSAVTKVNNPDFSTLPIELITSGNDLTINSGIPLSGSFFLAKGFAPDTQLVGIKNIVSNSEDIKDYLFS